MIQSDETVVVRTLSDVNSQVQILKAASDQKMGKSRVSLKDTVGHPLGSLFELNNRKYIYNLVTSWSLSYFPICMHIDWSLLKIRPVIIHAKIRPLSRQLFWVKGAKYCYTVFRRLGE